MGTFLTYIKEKPLFKILDQIPREQLLKKIGGGTFYIQILTLGCYLDYTYKVKPLK